MGGDGGGPGKPESGDLGSVAPDPEDFIRPAETSSLPGVYFIGPYGRRVSFASQQRRALNTVWALEQAGRLKAGMRVAVIGAGLAGVTAAVALAARKLKVSLYEEKPNALTLQIQTTHRFVHPSINFWPKETLRPSTSFPFFDWAAGVCDDIARVINDEWVQVREILKAAQTLQRFHNNTPIQSIASSGGKVTVTPRKSHHVTADYQAVIVTTGFGLEEKEANTDTVSYWRQDQVETEVRDSDRTRLLVSGTGDGGLIDTLRLLHRKFDTGRFCIEIAERLARDVDAADALLVLENEVQTIFTEAYAAALVADPPATPKAAGIAAANAASEAYAQRLDVYIQSRLPDDIAEDLVHSLIREPGRELRLVGRLVRPYSMNAAPIHRLLLAHALARGAVVYHRGSLKGLAGTRLVIRTDAGDEDVIPEYSIARHGSTLPIMDFIKDEDERLDLQRRQEQAASWAEFDAVPRGYFNFDNYPPHDPTHSKFIISRYARAEDYVKAVGGGMIGAKVRNRRLDVFPRPDTPYAPEKLPEELFGIPLNKAPLKTFGRGTGSQTRGR